MGEVTEPERQRTAHVVTAMAAALAAARRRAEAQEILSQERRLEGSAGIVVPGCEAKLKRARQAEDESLEEFDRALRGWMLSRSAPRATPEA